MKPVPPKMINVGNPSPIEMIRKTIIENAGSGELPIPTKNDLKKDENFYETLFANNTANDVDLY